MCKKALAMLLSLIVATACFNSKASSDENTYFGVRATLELSSSSHSWAQWGIDLNGWGAGGAVGGIYHAGFKKKFFFEGGLMAAVSNLPTNGTVMVGNNKRTLYGHAYITSIKIPLMVGYDFYKNKDIKLSAFVGPTLYVQFACSGTHGVRIGSEKVVDPDFKDLGGLDVGVGGGVALTYRKHWVVQFDGLYGFGKVCAIEPYNAHLKRSALDITFGYNF